MKGAVMSVDEKTVDNEERTACEIWTRVMGYYRPVAAFNKGKRSEYKDRKCFKEGCCCSKSGS
jgi:hypothetical protein